MIARSARPASQRLVLIVGMALYGLLALGATGCSNERLIGWTVTRKLDDYLDFTSAQKKAARARVDETLVVVRQQELPHWINLLREVRKEMHDGLTPEQLERLDRRYRQRLDAGVDLLVPRLSPLLAELSDAQRKHFVARMREDLAEDYEDLALPPDERRKQSEKKALKALERFVGDLSGAQEARVREMVRTLPDERPTMHRLAEARIARLDAFLAKKPPASAVETELRAMWAERDEGLGDPAARRAWQQKALIDVYRMLDAEQRAHAEQFITDRISMLRRFAES